jgi:hypothetical protein
MPAITTKAAMFDVWQAAKWSEAEAIPAAEVLICWKHNLGTGVVDLLVTVFPDDRNYYDPYWDCTWGACFKDWLDPTNNTMTPENVFGEMATFYGFANKLVAEKAIVMFSRIRECDWARKMLGRDSVDRLVKAGLTARW